LPPLRRVNTATVATRVGEHAKALELLGSAAEIFRTELCDDTLDYASVLRTRAVAHEGLGDLEAALSARRAELVIRTKRSSPTARSRISTLLKTVDLLCRLGRPDEANEMAEAAIGALDPDDPAQAEQIGQFRSAIAECAPDDVGS